MNYNSINSSVVVLDVLDRYNIKSQDFISRSPRWIVDCLDDLKLSNNTVTKVYKARFNNNRCLLPEFCKKVQWVVFDNNPKNKAQYNSSLYVIDDTIDLNRNAVFEGENTDNDVITSVNNNSELDTAFYQSGIPPFYRISNGWLHTNLKFGTIEIHYNKLETILDNELGLEFPVIPDEFNVKEAISCFILKTIIMRGYVHPILNLRDRDATLNPAIGYIKYAAKARVYASRGNADSRDKFTRPLAAIFGRRKNVYIKTNTPSVNSGIDMQVPELPRIIRIAVGEIFENTSTINYLKDLNISFNSPIKEGFNYLFISIPKYDILNVRNSLNIDISNDFTKIGDDVSDGYYDNFIYRLNTQFYTGIESTFNLTIT